MCNVQVAGVTYCSSAPCVLSLPFLFQHNDGFQLEKWIDRQAKNR
jgi:hypothetical protein